MIDRDIHLARALLVDSNALLRSVASSQLRDLGIAHVSQASRIGQARLLLEREHFDIVLCNLEFEGSAESGQDLLEELRRENQLPLSTVFLMVTSQPSYAKVVEAAESALDGFLVRPFSAAVLSARLTEARSRKRELADVLRALDAGEQELALVHAVKRFHEKQRYGAYCGRLAAELLLSLQRPDDAQRLFTLILSGKPDATWARLGIARAQLAQGDGLKARQTVALVLADEPGAADAHDLMGRLLVEQSDFDGALQAYRRAAELTPACLLRAQHAGALAYYQGQHDDALASLERALSMGLQSKLFDPLSLVLIALLRHDVGDHAGVNTARLQLRRHRETVAEPSARLPRFERALDVLVGLPAAQPLEALQTLRALTAESTDDDFDLVAANTVLALWARVPPALKTDAALAAEHDAALDAIAMRFCTGKTQGEVLAASAGRTEHALERIRASQARVARHAEDAMAQAMQGDAAGAVQALLTVGEATHNRKLLDMAGLIAKRYQASEPQVLQLQERAALFARRSGQAISHIAGMHRSARAAGGLPVRARQANNKEDHEVTDGAA